MTLSYAGCELCPRNCGAQRDKGETGYCGVTDEAVISSAFPHRGEESELSGTKGSGTIFFCGCNLKCIFCQNHDISRSIKGGRPASVDKLVHIMLSLEHSGCHNINFVTPTHITPTIVEAIHAARGQGLSVPTVYNCGGYEHHEVITELEGNIDIYMPDMKFFDAQRSRTFLNAPDYPDVVKKAVLLMDRQVGKLTCTQEGIAQQGLLIRHLVMPGGYKDSKSIIDFIAQDLTPGTAINVMGQYRPCFKAVNYKEIADYPEMREILDLKKYAHDKGLNVIGE